MKSSWNKDGEWPKNQRVITPSDSVNLPDRTVIYVAAAGNVVLVDKNDVVVTYTGLPAGATLPVQAKRINATNTTATLVGVW